MSNRRAAFAASAVLLAAGAARPCVADLGLDAWRGGDGLAGMQCPARVAQVALQASMPESSAQAVFAEFVDGRARGQSGTLDLDVTEGGRRDRIFRVRFAALEQPAQFMLALFMNDGSSRAACDVRIAPRATPFTLELPLSGFRQALGVADFRDVDYLLMVTRRPATARGSARVESIEVGSGHLPGALVARCR
jgi:hypothetical protein